MAYKPPTIEERIYKALEAVDLKTKGEVGAHLSHNGHASLTVCPLCRLDDFRHFEGCRLSGAPVTRGGR